MRWSPVHGAEPLAESSFSIVHRGSYDVIKMLKSRLVTLGHEPCSSLHLSNTSEDRFARDNKNLVENQMDATLGAHSSDTNMGLESNRAARLSDLERTLLNLFRETDDAC